MVTQKLTIINYKLWSLSKKKKTLVEFFLGKFALNSSTIFQI